MIVFKYADDGTFVGTVGIIHDDSLYNMITHTHADG